VTPILRLAFANFIARRARFALTILAVALSVSLVVAITSGYASLERAIRSYVDDYIGSTDFELTQPDDPLPGIAAGVIEKLRADPRVSKITARVEAFVTPLDDTGRPIAAARTMLFGIEDDPSSVGRPPKMDAGRFLKPGEHDAFVVDQNTLEAMNKKVGDVVTFGGREKQMQLKIVGVVHKPSLMRAFFKSGYVNIRPLGEFIAPDRPGNASKLRGEFNLNVDAKAFMAEWSKTLADLGPHYKLKLVRDNRADLDRNLMGLRLVSYFGSTISLSAAAFIILATLMTGVQEQRRQLAMLRAVGATKLQVARLVTLEGLAIGITGAIIGIPMGIAGLYLLSLVFPHIFDGGVALSPTGMLYAIVVAALASFIASILPAIAASRSKPVEAMADASDTGDRPGTLPWKWIAIGAFLASLDSLIIFGPLPRLLEGLGVSAAYARETRLFGHILIGLPMLLLGALLFAPLVVKLVELIGNRVLPTLLQLPAPLLKQQLTESPWRSAATGVAMMIGLMLLITMNSQGRSALGAWKIPNRFPDVFIVPDAGYGTMIRPAEIEKIRNLPQVQPGRVMPITLAAPLLAQKIFDVAGTAMPARTMFIGIDPTLAFDMMELDFRAGDEATAKRMLIGGRAITLKDGTVLHGTVEPDSTPAALRLRTLNNEVRAIDRTQIQKDEPGKYLVVTDEFRKLRGMNVGDTFPLESGLIMSSTVDFVIVGVVWSPGMDVMLNAFDLPTRIKEQTAATVFGTVAQGKETFEIRDALLLAADLKMGADKLEMADQMRLALGREGLNVADVRQLKHDITQTFERLLRFASTVAWLAMGVATLGVGNAIVAGIRTRQWRLGVLRAIGLTRAELLRLLLAEAMLLSLVGVVLGVGFGLLLAMNARHLYSVALGFDPPLVLPWDLIALAAGVVVVLGLLATIVPAALTARKEPLGLLQAGRAAT
jgi:putative ABC transport system permease protein